MTDSLQEKVLEAWVGLTGALKNSRLTRELPYNETIALLLAYRQYQEDGVGRVAVRTIVEYTRMLKSQVNRTVDSLVHKGYLYKERGLQDARTVYVRLNLDRLSDFLTVHNRSLAIVDQVISIIGPEDACAFVRIFQKISAADLRLEEIDVPKEAL